MNTVRKPAPADATATSLSLIAGKLESMDQRQQTGMAELRADITDLRSDVTELRADNADLRQGQHKLEAKVDQVVETMNANHLDIHRSLSAIMAHLGIPKPAK